MKVIEDVTVQPFGRMLSIIGKSYLHTLNLKLKSLDIERNYYALLLINNAEGKIAQQELACMLDIDKVTMVRSIDYLSENGYVKRVRDNNDKRKYCLVLTKKAIIALPEIIRSFKEVNSIALKGLSSSQITELQSSLKIIKNNLTEYTSSL
jgi:MarR family transcriptional regulator for hemolysin